MTYRQAMDALHDAYLTLLNILQTPLEPNTREQLKLFLTWLSWWSGTTAADDG